MCRSSVLALLIFAALTGPVLARGEVALTFDDGPTPGVTDRVLDSLKKENVKATFFVIGRKVKAQPDLARRITAEGHEIGNHTYHHSRLTDIGDRRFIDELTATSRLIEQTTGQKVRLFRPPHGKITAAKRRLLKKYGYQVVLWTINGDDYFKEGRGIRPPGSTASRVVGRVKPGAIILVHDNSRQIVEAVPLIVKRLKNKKYVLVTASELSRFKLAIRPSPGSPKGPLPD